MFTIMRKTVDGRRSESYYQKRDNAKRELLESVSRTVNHIGCTIIRTVDRFNEEKGFRWKEPCRRVRNAPGLS